MSPAKLADLPGVPRRRVRTLPAAAMMLDRVLKHLTPEHVVFSALGLREGWIFSQLDPEERYLDPLIEGAQLVGLPLARVPDFATALVPWTAGLLDDEGTNDKRLRIALCALSDIGWRDHADIPMVSLTCTLRQGAVKCLSPRRTRWSLSPSSSIHHERPLAPLPLSRSAALKAYRPRPHRC